MLNQAKVNLFPTFWVFLQCPLGIHKQEMEICQSPALALLQFEACHTKTRVLKTNGSIDLYSLNVSDLFLNSLTLVTTTITCGNGFIA